DINHRAAQILALNPKIIVIQTEMIIGRRRGTTRKLDILPRELGKRLGDWAKLLREPLMYTFKSQREMSPDMKRLLNALWAPAKVDIGVLNETSEKEDKEVAKNDLEKARELWTNQDISTKAPDFKEGRKFIKHAQKKGIVVIIAETPLSETSRKFV